eukprot:scaffold36955_cov69-Phaeocystis_antarctica.AAC.14
MRAAHCPRASRVTASCASATSCSRARPELARARRELPVSVARPRHGPPTRLRRARAVAKESKSTCCHSSAYARQCKWARAGADNSSRPRRVVSCKAPVATP